MRDAGQARRLSRALCWILQVELCFLKHALQEALLEQLVRTAWLIDVEREAQQNVQFAFSSNSE